MTDSQKRRRNPADPIARRLREIRVRILQESQTKFGGRYDKSKGLISQWEQGTGRPTYEDLAQIARDAGTTIDEIIIGDSMLLREPPGKPYLASVSTNYLEDGLEFDREAVRALPKAVRKQIEGYITRALEENPPATRQKKYGRHTQRFANRPADDAASVGKKK